MAQMKIVYTTSEKLPELDVVNGQIIFEEDTHTIYMDMKGKRTSYSTIYVFSTESERINYSDPLFGFYFVEETNIVWRYKNKWIQVTGSPSSVLYFGDVPNNFPIEGQEGILYCSDNGVYKWDPYNKIYHLIANKNVWEEV